MSRLLLHGVALALAVACRPVNDPAPRATPAPAPVVAPTPAASVAVPAARTHPPMPALDPTSGRAPTSVFVLMHGYGANSADLRPVAQRLALGLPDTVFLLPDAFEPVPGSPDGRQWFAFAGADDRARLAGVRAASARLVAWIDEELRDRHLTRARLAVGGFSQGAMMAIDLGLHMSPAPAGVVSLSGRLVDDANPSAAPAPVLVVHGTADARIDVSSARYAITRLGELHVRTESLILPDVGHTITPEGIAATERFLRGLWP